MGCSLTSPSISPDNVASFLTTSEEGGPSGVTSLPILNPPAIFNPAEFNVKTPLESVIVTALSASRRSRVPQGATCTAYRYRTLPSSTRPPPISRVSDPEKAIVKLLLSSGFSQCSNFSVGINSNRSAVFRKRNFINLTSAAPPPSIRSSLPSLSSIPLSVAVTVTVLSGLSPLVVMIIALAPTLTAPNPIVSSRIGRIKVNGKISGRSKSDIGGIKVTSDP